MKTHRAPLILAITALTMTIAVSANVLSLVNAQVEPYASIYPSQGDVQTDIYIQIRGLANIRYSLYLFWDSTLTIEAMENPSGSDGMTRWYYGYYDIHMYAPNEHPSSDLGNHTIVIQVWSSPTEGLNFTLTFEIIEQLHCNEWLALNTTYSQLLSDYDALNVSSQILMNQLNVLSASHAELLNEYSVLLEDYSNLLGSYGSLSSDYDEMNTTYHELEANFQSLNTTYSNLNTGYQNLQNSYSGLTGSYNTLQSIYSTLALNHAQLQGNYTQLASLYSDLQTDQSNLSADLTNYRNLSYVLIATTLVFITTTIYFARRKTKLKNQ